MIELIIVLTFSGTAFMLGVMTGHNRARPSEHKLAQIRKVMQSQETEARLMKWPDGDEASNANAYEKIRDIITK